MRLASANALPLNADAAPSRGRIEAAARSLETQFASMLIKSMRGAGMGNAIMGGNETYRDMFDQQLSKELTKGRGLGLAPMIVRQLEKNSAPAPTPAAQAAPMPLDLQVNLPMAMPLGSTVGAASLSTAALGGLAPTSSGVSMAAVAPLPAPVPDAVAATGTPAFECDPNAKLDCSSPEAFVKSIWPHAQKTAAELGVSPKALVAQACLETGWGRRLIGRQTGEVSHNLFGIKAGGSWKGDAVKSGTHEYVGGVRVNERAAFRAYGSAAESFADYARLMKRERYSGALAAGTDVHGFARGLQRAGYATDPAYANKITAIAEGATLRRALAGLTAPQYAANTPANAASKG